MFGRMLTGLCFVSQFLSPFLNTGVINCHFLVFAATLRLQLRGQNFDEESQKNI